MEGKGRQQHPGTKRERFNILPLPSLLDLDVDAFFFSETIKHFGFLPLLEALTNSKLIISFLSQEGGREFGWLPQILGN